MKNEKYISPMTERLETISEGVLCTSGFASDSDDTNLLYNPTSFY